MKNNYRRPAIELNYWLVNNRDLERLCQFLDKRVQEENIKIKVHTNSGNDKECESFEEFSNYMQQLVSAKEESEKIDITKAALHPEQTFKHIWVEINFKFSWARFNLAAEDMDGSLRDWVSGAYEEMQQLVNSFKPNQDLEELIKKKFAKDYRDGAIVFDYDANILKQLTREVQEQQIREAQPLTREVQEQQIREAQPSVKLRWYQSREIQAALIIAFVTFLVFLLSKIFK